MLFHMNMLRAVVIADWKLCDCQKKVGDLPHYAGFSGFHNPENFFLAHQVEIMLDHQLHDTGGDGKVNQFLRGELVHQAMDQSSGEGISRADCFQAVYSMDGAFIETSVL